MTKTTFQPILREQVTKVYSGRPGCACGCRGKYTVPAERMTPDNPLSARQRAAINAQVSRVLGIVNAAMQPGSTVDLLEFDEEWVAVEVGNHAYTVYFER